MPVRRVQEVGGGSLSITLPRGWAKRQGLGKGSLVVVEESPTGALTVVPAEPREAVTTISHSPGDVRGTVRKLFAAYLDGYDVIDVVSEGFIPSEDRSVIKRAASALPGLEVLGEEASKISLRCVLDPSLLNPRELMTRLGDLVAGMLRDLSRAMESGGADLAELVAERDDEVDRLYFLLVRLVRKSAMDPSLASKSGLSPAELIDYRVAALLLESAADSLVLLARSYRVFGAPEPELARVAGSAADLVRRCLQALLERDVPSAVEAQSSARSLERELAGYEGPAARSADYLGDVLDRLIDVCDLVSPGAGHQALT